MKIKSFTYTKANAQVSQRTIIEQTAPSTFSEGIDITSLSAEAQAEIINKAALAHMRYVEAMQLLQEEYDLVHNYRRFDPLKMIGVTVEYA